MCKLSGLVVGFVSWTGASIVMGWAVGRFGLWGVDKQAARLPTLDIIGVACCVTAIFGMLFVKPDNKTLENLKSQANEKKSKEKAKHESKLKHSKKSKKRSSKLVREQEKEQEKEKEEKKSHPKIININTNKGESNTKVYASKTLGPIGTKELYQPLSPNYDDPNIYNDNNNSNNSNNNNEKNDLLFPKLTRLGPVTPATPTNIAISMTPGTPRTPVARATPTLSSVGGASRMSSNTSNVSNTSNSSNSMDDSDSDGDGDDDSDSMNNSLSLRQRGKKRKKVRRSSYTDYELLITSSQRNLLGGKSQYTSDNTPLAYLFGFGGSFLDYNQVAFDTVKKEEEESMANSNNNNNNDGGLMQVLDLNFDVQSENNAHESRLIEYNTPSINQGPSINNGTQSPIKMKMKMKTGKKSLRNSKIGMIIGSLMAVSQGTISGNVNSFYLSWTSKHNNESTLNYCFAYYLGIYLGATIMFILMGLYRKANKKSWKKPVIRPAFFSGAMFGVGYAALLFSSDYLVFPVVFVCCNVGAIIISNCWSIFYFKEVSDAKSFRILISAISLMCVGIVAEAIAA